MHQAWLTNMTFSNPSFSHDNSPLDVLTLLRLITKKCLQAAMEVQN